MSRQQQVLLCYRGRYRPQVELLARKLRDRGLRVSYDREILAAPGAESSGEAVEWIEVDPAEQHADVSWRAPLRQAVAASEVIVFLVDPVDQTSNTYNEIAWVARSGRHAFVIFDTGAQSISEEAQGIFVSQLNITCAVALRTFEVPDYEYLFLAHQDPRELDARLDVVVHRVQEYLERVRHRPPRTFRMDQGVQHVSELADLPLTRARQRRTDIQERWCSAFGIPAPASDLGAHDAVLDVAYQYEKSATFEQDGEFIRPPGSPYRFPRASEQRRFQRTNRLIERVHPGPREVPTLFAGLARQAASIELVLESAVDSPHAFEPVVLLATLPLTAVEDVSYIATGPDFAIVWVDRAFADFIYQVSKATVRSWKLFTDPNAPRAQLSGRADDVAETLDADPSIAQGFFHCVRKYVGDGAPGASSDGPPRLAYQAALTPLVGMAERFMLARGYSWLALKDPQFPARLVGGMPPPKSMREAVLQHDFLAAVYVLTSCAQIDRLPPALALQGCGMPLVCAGLVQRAVLTMDPAAPASTAAGVPSFGERLRALERAYVEFMKAQGRSAQAEHDLAPVRHAWQTPALLWQRVESLLVAERERGLALADVWREPRVRRDLAALLAPAP